jgi:hypothetical protein
MEKFKLLSKNSTFSFPCITIQILQVRQKINTIVLGLEQYIQNHKLLHVAGLIALLPVSAINCIE